jgi:hypothetical protein
MIVFSSFNDNKEESDRNVLLAFLIWTAVQLVGWGRVTERWFHWRAKSRQNDLEILEIIRTKSAAQ